MASTRDAIRGRILNLLPYLRLTLAQSPFDFDTMPTGVIDACARVEIASRGTLGGLCFTEDRTDLVSIWIARKQSADPEAAYQRLLEDVESVTSAVVHDGAETSGEYAVLDDMAVAVSHEKGQEYAVARLDLPVNYEVEL